LREPRTQIVGRVGRGETMIEAAAKSRVRCDLVVSVQLMLS
jgi:hypothetical protein